MSSPSHVRGMPFERERHRTTFRLLVGAALLSAVLTGVNLAARSDAGWLLGVSFVVALAVLALVLHLGVLLFTGESRR